MSARAAQSACIAIVLCAVVASAQAQWKWKDANGHVQYSDLPPPAAIPEHDILQRPGAGRHASPAVSPTSAAASRPAAASTGVDPALEAKKRKLDEDEAVRTAAKLKADEDKRAAQRREACTQARSQLRTLDDGMRIARINAQGEREYLDDQARAGETRRARDVIASDCK